MKVYVVPMVNPVKVMEVALEEAVCVVVVGDEATE